MAEDSQVDENDILTILEEYTSEYYKDTHIDEIKLREMELKVPGLKGKWASYKAINKAKLFKLKKQREELMDNGIDMIKQKREADGNPVSYKGAENILRNTKKFKELNKQIERLTILCDYFEDALKNIQSIGFDIKNLIDTIKLDEM